MISSKVSETALGLSTLLLALTAIPAHSATPAAPVIVSAVLNTASKQITISGTNFMPATTAPTVTLDGTKLTLVSSTTVKVVAAQPTTLAPGSYLLSVTSSAGTIGTFSMTLGAAGPEGPVGPAGPARRGRS
jgi:hypothetical protein